MKVKELAERTPQHIAELLAVWESSVRATHLFLSSEEVDAIKAYVPRALEGVEILIEARSDEGEALAFMGVQDGRLEMLFVDAGQRGKGIGSELLRLGMERYGVRELTVNEQNPQAVGFYEHFGFATYKRSELDEEGNPYPLLYMRRAS